MERCLYRLVDFPELDPAGLPAFSTETGIELGTFGRRVLTDDGWCVEIVGLPVPWLVGNVSFSFDPRNGWPGDAR